MCVCVQVCLRACAEKSKEKSVFFGVCPHCTHRQRRAEIILTNCVLSLSSPTHPPHPTHGLRLAPQMVSHTTLTYARSYWHISQNTYTHQYQSYLRVTYCSLSMSAMCHPLRGHFPKWFTQLRGGPPRFQPKQNSSEMFLTAKWFSVHPWHSNVVYFSKQISRPDVTG